MLIVSSPWLRCLCQYLCMQERCGAGHFGALTPISCLRSPPLHVVEISVRRVVLTALCKSEQVTNPAIDPLREGLVMSLAVRLGKRGNLLQPGPGAYSQVAPVPRAVLGGLQHVCVRLLLPPQVQAVTCHAPVLFWIPESNI